MKFSSLLISILCISSCCYGWKIETEPFEKIPMYSTQDLSFKLQIEEEDGSIKNITKDGVKVDLKIQNPEAWAVKIESSETLIFYKDEIRKSKEVRLRGDILGVEVLEFWINERNVHNETIYVIMADRTLNDLFTLIMILMVVVNTINMGAQLDIEVIKSVFKKPVGPFVGFICQFGFMPLFSFFIGWLITEDKLFRLGLFVLGCCPGGTGSNFWTLLLNGDINMSITMTFMSTVLALGFMPLWIFSLGPFLTTDELVMPFKELIGTLFSLIVPTALGMWIRWRWSKAAKIMEKIIVPFTLLTVLFIFTAGVYINLFIFILITPLMVMAGFAVAIAGYLFGAGLAFLFRLNRAQIIAVAIETSFQNASIAFILMKISLPEPYGELGSVAPVAQLIVTGWPLWLVYFALKIYQRCCKKKDSQDEKKDEYLQVDQKDSNDNALYPRFDSKE